MLGLRLVFVLRAALGLWFGLGLGVGFGLGLGIESGLWVRVVLARFL